MSHEEFQVNRRFAVGLKVKEFLKETRRSHQSSLSPPRAAVTHYESPPRRKLRQEEDDNLAEIEGNSKKSDDTALHREAPEQKIDTQGTVNRLLMAKQEKEDRLSYLRQRVSNDV